LLSLRCALSGGNAAEPDGASAAHDVRVASFWGCASAPGLRLTVDVLCDEDPTCVARVARVVRRKAAADGSRLSAELVRQGDMALRTDGAEFVGAETGSIAEAAVGFNSVFIPSTELGHAFGAARGFAAVMQHLDSRCMPLNDDAP
jgi:hypothetical protein